MKLFDLINPVKIMAFFTFYGGGSGGGSSNPDTRYANLDQLYGTQNQASQFMLNNAMPQVPYITDNSRTMVNQAMDGTLANQMRQQAGNNAQATFGAAMDSNNRNMQRFGMGMNANRIMSENNRNAIMGAGMKAGEMNKAGAAAEDMKWNRNANFYGQVMGMNNGAMQGMSAAGSGYANTANAMSANDAANAKGYGQAGAAFGNALFKADGGYIKAPGLADGGDAWAAYKAANPVKPMSSSGGSRSRTSALGAMFGGAAPQMLGAGLKDAFKGKDGKIYKFGKEGYDKFVADSNAPVSDTASGAVQYADGSTAMYGGDIGADSVGAYYDAGNLAGAGSAVGAGADVASGADYVNAVSSAAPVAEVGSAAGTMVDSMGMWADGGYIRKPGLHLAMGGLANNSMSKSNQIDGNSGLANMDASGNMSVANMGTTKTSNAVGKPETHAKPVLDTQYSGRTDGMGEGSDGDPDGFGSKGADNRHMAGKMTMNIAGRAMFGEYGGMAGSALAELIHPIMEPLTRELVSSGDRVGGVTGAMLHDPAAAIASGKYSNAELLKGYTAVAAGMPFLGKSISKANGGAIAGRVDHTGGGKVQGPGTETSDDIPAWLSDGEFVLNAHAVKLIGKAKLEKLNKQGLKLRGKEEESAEGTPNVKDSPAEEAKEMKRGLKMKAPTPFKVKRTVKLKDGGSITDEQHYGQPGGLKTKRKGC